MIFGVFAGLSENAWFAREQEEALPAFARKAQTKKWRVSMWNAIHPRRHLVDCRPEHVGIR